MRHRHEHQFPPPKCTIYTQSCGDSNVSHQCDFFWTSPKLADDTMKNNWQEIVCHFDMLKRNMSWKCCLFFILQTQKSLLNLDYKVKLFLSNIHWQICYCLCSTVMQLCKEFYFRFCQMINDKIVFCFSLIVLCEHWPKHVKCCIIHIQHRPAQLISGLELLWVIISPNCQNIMEPKSLCV